MCQADDVEIAQVKHIVINAPSAKYADSFCLIKMVNPDELQTETHQCKLRNKSISQEEFDNEHKKATSPNDNFIFYTPAPSKNLVLRPISAIVDKIMKEYFGPFSGR